MFFEHVKLYRGNPNVCMEEEGQDYIDVNLRKANLRVVCASGFSSQLVQLQSCQIIILSSDIVLDLEKD